MAIFVAKSGQLQTVKGVYECKNILREGVDYETYDWLKANIPISTIMAQLPVNSKNFEFKRNFIQLMNSGYFGTSDSNNDYTYFITNYSTVPNNYKPQIWSRNKSQAIYVFPSKIGLGIHTIIANDDKVTISSTTRTASLPWYGEQVRIMFNNATNINKNTICLTSSIKVDGVVRYVPCQLLRSIPATLDANGKDRVTGECGMYDAVSGKFFGNVASTGSFTVTND